MKLVDSCLLQGVFFFGRVFLLVGKHSLPKKGAC